MHRNQPATIFHLYPLWAQRSKDTGLQTCLCVPQMKNRNYEFIHCIYLPSGDASAVLQFLSAEKTEEK